MTTTPNTQSKIAKDQNTLVTATDIYADYAITQNAAMGSEVEYLVATPDNRLISPALHDTLKSVLSEADIAVSDEPLASIFELKTGAHRAAAPLIAEMAQASHNFKTQIERAGFSVHQIGYLGNINLKDAMAARLPSERADGLLEHFIKTGHELCARQPLMTTSVHLSIGYADIDDAYDAGRILMALTPSLTALCENTGGVFDGQMCRFNPSATIRLSQQDGRAGLSPVICAAANGEDMMRRQANHIFLTPMMMHIDETGAMRVTDESGMQPNMHHLQSRNLATRSNAMLSESMQYHMLKLTSLRDSFGRMTGKRIEVRMADNGPFQHNLLAKIGEAVGLDKDRRADIARDLKQAGLDPFAMTSGPSCITALNHVAMHREHAMKIPLGKSSTGHITSRLLDILDDGSDDIALARSTLKQGPAPTPIILRM